MHSPVRRATKNDEVEVASFGIRDSSFGICESGAGMELAGHRALVTGGAQRIGAELCRALAAVGCHVAVHYHRSRDAAESLADELEAHGLRAAAVAGDLGGGDDELADIVARATEAIGPLDILVNNAAVFHKGALAGLDPARLRGELEVNMLAPVRLAQVFAESVQAAVTGGGVHGRIVNLLDRRVAGFEAGCIPYLLSKKGLADFTRCAALEWAPHITVNGVAPGAILPPPGKDAAYLREHAGRIPLDGDLAPSDVVSAVLFALQSDVMTGQILYVDGGQHLLGGMGNG